MNSITSTNIRSEVARYVPLVSSRDPVRIDAKAAELTSYLEAQTGDHSKALLLFVKGMTKHSQTHYNEAKEFFQQCFELDINDRDVLGAAHMAFGFSSRSLGNLDEAVNYLYQAAELIDSNGEFKITLPNCYHQLGEIHILINEHKMAIEYFNKAIAISENGTENTALFRVYNGLGICHQSMKEYEKGKEYLTKALRVENLSDALISRGQSDLGILHLELKEYPEAEKLLLSSLKIREKNNLEDASSTSMVYLAEVYIGENKISEAIDLLNRCKVITEKYQTKWKEIKVLGLLASAHSLNGDYKTANQYYQQYNTLQNEVKGEQERKIFKLKNEQIEKQKKIISDKHNQLMATFDEIKRLKINRKAVFFSWVTVIVLVLISEIFLDPLIENYAYNNILSLLVKVLIALLFKPIDGLYEKILLDKALKKVN